jgi:hypothetical protein
MPKSDALFASETRSDLASIPGTGRPSSDPTAAPIPSTTVIAKPTFAVGQKSPRLFADAPSWAARVGPSSRLWTLDWTRARDGWGRSRFRLSALCLFGLSAGSRRRRSGRFRLRSASRSRRDRGSLAGAGAGLTECARGSTTPSSLPIPCSGVTSGFRGARGLACASLCGYRGGSGSGRGRSPGWRRRRSGRRRRR